MDALTEVLNSVRVRSTVYCPIEIGAPWGLYIPEESGASFCIIVKGSAYLAYANTVTDEQSNWFAAAADPQIGEAIANIHRTPQNQWTVERLATLSTMSRSAFANRFAKLVGEPPLRYLARWRMHKAIDMIQEGRRRRQRSPLSSGTKVRRRSVRRLKNGTGGAGSLSPSSNIEIRNRTYRTYRTYRTKSN